MKAGDGSGISRTHRQPPSPDSVQRQDPCQIQHRGNVVVLGFGGVILGLSLGDVLQGKLPLSGVQGKGSLQRAYATELPNTLSFN